MNAHYISWSLSSNILHFTDVKCNWECMHNSNSLWSFYIMWYVHRKNKYSLCCEPTKCAEHVIKRNENNQQTKIAVIS